MVEILVLSPGAIGDRNGAIDRERNGNATGRRLPGEAVPHRTNVKPKARFRTGRGCRDDEARAVSRLRALSPEPRSLAR
jgi:hypothetical protein